MAAEKPRTAEKQAAKKKQAWITIVDEVDTKNWRRDCTN
jgi:hypothetical protein